MPGDTEAYKASPVNRFRLSWYFLHLAASFWRVTQTTKSIHTFLRTPGAFAYTRALANLTPDMLAQVMLKHSGGKLSVQSLLADQSLPALVRKALTSLHQSTASVVGSDGHRRLLRQEGVAYTLCFGPPLAFVTPNLADTRQRLLLVVQGEQVHMDADLPGYREMTERLAQDPVAQAIVFEIMIRLFFLHVLGVRPECVGFRRGEVRSITKEWCTDGCAASGHGFGFLGPILAARGEVEAQVESE